MTGANSLSAEVKTNSRFFLIGDYFTIRTLLNHHNCLHINTSLRVHCICIKVSLPSILCLVFLQTYCEKKLACIEFLKKNIKCVSSA